MTWIIYALATVGALTIFAQVLAPLFWCGAYATGYTIFRVLVARAGDRVSLWAIVKAIPACWLRGFIESTRLPCSESRIGRMRWVPLFGFHGFGRSNPAE